MSPVRLSESRNSFWMSSSRCLTKLTWLREPAPYRPGFRRGYFFAKSTKLVWRFVFPSRLNRLWMPSCALIADFIMRDSQLSLLLPSTEAASFTFWTAHYS